MTPSTTAALIKAAREVCANFYGGTEEKFCNSEYGSYWSPHAAMVESSLINALRQALAAIEAQPPSGPPVRKYCGMCMPSKAYMHQPAAIEAQQNTAGIELPGIRQLPEASASGFVSPASRTGLPNNCEGGMQPPAPSECNYGFHNTKADGFCAICGVQTVGTEQPPARHEYEALKGAAQEGKKTLTALERVCATQPPAQQPQQDVVERVAQAVADEITIQADGGVLMWSGDPFQLDNEAIAYAAIAAIPTPAMEQENRDHIQHIKHLEAELERHQRACEVLREGLREIGRDVVWVESGTGFEHCGLTEGEIKTLRAIPDRADKTLARADAVLKGEE